MLEFVQCTISPIEHDSKTHCLEAIKMTKQTAFEDVTKAQQIIMDAIDKTTRANLAAVEKMMDLNKQRFSSLGDASDPADFVAKQSTVFKTYAEEMNQQFETLAAIGNDSREQLMELGQDFAKNLDFTSIFDPSKTQGRSKAKSGAKTA
jgi:hypothetical protein